jgi:hypothetical protein
MVIYQFSLQERCSSFFVSFFAGLLRKKLSVFKGLWVFESVTCRIQDELMIKHHYLGFRKLVGESIRYMTIYQGETVALLGWSSAAYKSRHRDQWIGWSEEQRHQRLSFIANNSRFLILPNIRVKNLASKILSLNTKRLSDDWQAAYGHPIVLAETFIEHRRFSGACYRAAGWFALGQTRGFGRNAGRYYAHGLSKTILIKPLHPDVKGLFCSPFLSPALNPDTTIDLNQLNVFGTHGLLEHLALLSDSRMPRGVRFSHVTILAIGICAWLSGAQSFGQMGQWAEQLSQSLLKQFGCRFDDNRRSYIAPSDETLRRIFHLTDGEVLDYTIKCWLTTACEQPGLNRNMRQKVQRLLDQKGYRISVFVARQSGRYTRPRATKRGVQT